MLRETYTLLLLFSAPPTVTTAPGGGFQHLPCGMGDPGISQVPQTLHTIEQGIAT